MYFEGIFSLASEKGNVLFFGEISINQMKFEKFVRYIYRIVTNEMNDEVFNF